MAACATGRRGDRGSADSDRDGQAMALNCAEFSCRAPGEECVRKRAACVARRSPEVFDGVGRRAARAGRGALVPRPRSVKLATGSEHRARYRVPVPLCCRAVVGTRVAARPAARRARVALAPPRAPATAGGTQEPLRHGLQTGRRLLTTAVSLHVITPLGPTVPPGEPATCITRASQTRSTPTLQRAPRTYAQAAPPAAACTCARE